MTTPKHVSGTIKAHMDKLRAAASRGPLTSREIFAMTDPIMDELARILAAIQPDPEPQPCVAERAETETQAALRDTRDPQEPQPVAWLAEEKSIWTDGEWHVRTFLEEPEAGKRYRNVTPLYATPSSAGTVSVEAAVAALKAMPRRMEFLGGQTTSYIQLGEALDILRTLAGERGGPVVSRRYTQ